MGRILAIDFGLKRTGLAVTDENCLIANPLDTVPTATAIQFLIQYCLKEKVDTFVVGKPIRWSGEDSSVAPFIEIFIKALKKALPAVPVERTDERFTSLLASRAIAQSGLKKKDRQDKSLIDKVSAAIMLQSYLEHIQNQG